MLSYCSNNTFRVPANNLLCSATNNSGNLHMPPWNYAYNRYSFFNCFIKLPSHPVAIRGIYSSNTNNNIRC